MRVRILLAVLAALLPIAAAAQPQRQSISSRLVIVYRNGVVPANIDETLSQLGLHAHSHLRHLGMTTLEIDARTNESALAHLRSLPQVAAVLQDR